MIFLFPSTGQRSHLINYEYFNNLAVKLTFGRTYIFVLGVVGSILAGGDVARIIMCGADVPDALKRHRYTPGAVVPVRYERDLKLLSSALVLEFFVLLTFGVVLDRSTLMVPWLLMQTCMVAGESFLFLIKLSECEPVEINGWVIICSLFAVFNWMQVFNELRRDEQDFCGFTNICGYKM